MNFLKYQEIELAVRANKAEIYENPSVEISRSDVYSGVCTVGVVKGIRKECV